MAVLGGVRWCTLRSRDGQRGGLVCGGVWTVCAARAGGVGTVCSTDL